MRTPLVILVGNAERGDDAVAHEVARLLRDLEAEGALLGARLLETVALDVAMASDVAEADPLIIVDAQRRGAPLVELVPIAPGVGVSNTHAVDPEGLLGVTEALYDRVPVAWLVTLAAPDMGHGSELSAVASAAAAAGAQAVRELLASIDGELPDRGSDA